MYSQSWDRIVQDQLNSLKVPYPMMGQGESMGTRIRDEWDYGGPISLPRDNHLLRERGHRRWSWRPWLLGACTCVQLVVLSPGIVLGAAITIIVAVILYMIALTIVYRSEAQETQDRQGTEYRKVFSRDLPYGGLVEERIGDAERDMVLAELVAHFTAGRLDADEYSDRADAVLRSKTGNHLIKTLSELPMLTSQERRMP